MENPSDFCKLSGDIHSLLGQGIKGLDRLRRDDSSLNQSLLLQVLEIQREGSTAREKLDQLQVPHLPTIVKEEHDLRAGGV